MVLGVVRVTSGLPRGSLDTQLILNLPVVRTVPNSGITAQWRRSNKKSDTADRGGGGGGGGVGKRVFNI